MSRLSALTSGLRFIATGIANTTIGLAVIILSREWGGANEYCANAAGYAVGLAVGFWLNRNWSFESRDNLYSTAFPYLLSFVVSYASNLGILYVGLEHTSLHPNLIHAAALSVYSAVFFLLCRWIVFRK